jgi:thiol:disulfide interchange protein DsbD
MDFGYEGEVMFPLTFTVDSTARSEPAVLHATVDWLVFKEACIPGRADLEEKVQIGADASGLVSPEDQALWDHLGHALPASLPSSEKAVFESTSNGFRLRVETGQKETQAAFFPTEQNVLDNPSPQTVIPTDKGIILDLKKDPSLTTNPPQLAGVVELSGGRNYMITAMPETVALPTPIPPASMLLQVSGFAFLGGLLLNLMPCVFPVLFIKGLALVQSSGEERDKLRVHGLIYTFGILVSFWVLVGALLGLRAAGSTLGWGFQFQSPVFLALMAALLFFLGLSLAGQFEIGLTLTGAGGSFAVKQLRASEQT